MSNFSGKILIIKDIAKKVTLDIFLNDNISKISEELYGKSDLPGGRKEADEFTKSFFDSNKTFTSGMILKPKKEYTILFLRNSAGFFEYIHSFGYEYNYKTKSYDYIKPSTIVLNNATAVIHNEDFDMPS